MSCGASAKPWPPDVLIMPPDIDSSYPLRPDHVRFFRENGYIRLKGALAPDALARYGPEISRILRGRGAQAPALAGRTGYDNAFIHVPDPWSQSDGVKRLVMSRRLARVACELLGCRGVRRYLEVALCKEPQAGPTPWHADQTCWPFDSDLAATAWIPLQATPIDMGPLRYAPGSFRIRAGRGVDITPEVEAQIQRELSVYPVDEAPYDLGEVSFHSGWTLHGARGNSTSRHREALSIFYIDRDMRLALPRTRSQEDDRRWFCSGIEVGQVLDSPRNPVLYERDE